MQGESTSPALQPYVMRMYIHLIRTCMYTCYLYVYLYVFFGSNIKQIDVQ